MQELDDSILKEQSVISIAKSKKIFLSKSLQIEAKKRSKAHDIPYLQNVFEISLNMYPTKSE